MNGGSGVSKGPGVKIVRAVVIQELIFLGGGEG